MATLGPRGVKGPLFEEDGPDLLDVVQHLLDLDDKQAYTKMWSNSEKAQRWVPNLLLLDIARSLRKIADSRRLA